MPRTFLPQRQRQASAVPRVATIARAPGAALIALLCLALPGCGRPIDTRAFDGRYELDTAATIAEYVAAAQAMSDRYDKDSAARARRLADWTAMERRQRRRFARFRIQGGTIRSGDQVTQEFVFRDASIAGDSLRGRAIWHEDVEDPGDYSEETLTLRLVGDTLLFIMYDERGRPATPIRLIRRR